MLKRIQVLEDGRVPAKKARDWKIEGQRMRPTLMNHWPAEKVGTKEQRAVSGVLVVTDVGETAPEV